MADRTGAVDRLPRPAGLDTVARAKLSSTTLYIDAHCCAPSPAAVPRPDPRPAPPLSPSPARFRSTIASIVGQPDETRELPPSIAARVVREVSTEPAFANYRLALLATPAHPAEPPAAEDTADKPA